MEYVCAALDPACIVQRPWFRRENFKQMFFGCSPRHSLQIWHGYTMEAPLNSQQPRLGGLDAMLKLFKRLLTVSGRLRTSWIWRWTCLSGPPGSTRSPPSPPTWRPPWRPLSETRTRSRWTPQAFTAAWGWWEEPAPPALGAASGSPSQGKTTWSLPGGPLFPGSLLYTHSTQCPRPRPPKWFWAHLLFECTMNLCYWLFFFGNNLFLLSFEKC